MSRFWVIVFCLPLIFRRHVCLSKLKQSPSRELPLSAGKTVFSHLKGVFTWENSHRRESHTGIIFFISYRIYMMTGSFQISLFEGTLHAAKIHVWFKIANITHALPVPVYRQTDFTPKRLVVSRLHDTAARFRTGLKFSPRYKNPGELTPGWLAPAWHFVVVSRKQI